MPLSQKVTKAKWYSKEGLVAVTLMVQLPRQAYKFAKVSKRWGFGDANRMLWRFSHQDKYIRYHGDDKDEYASVRQTVESELSDDMGE